MKSMKIFAIKIEVIAMVIKNISLGVKYAHPSRLYQFNEMKLTCTLGGVDRA